jgi:hypothetical protein
MNWFRHLLRVAVLPERLNEVERRMVAINLEFQARARTEIPVYFACGMKLTETPYPAAHRTARKQFFAWLRSKARQP